MRSLLVFLHLVFLTRLSDGAPLPQADDVVSNAETTANTLTCNILDVQVSNPQAAVDKLLSDGTLPAGLQGVSPDEVLSLLQSCITSGVSQIANSGSGDADDGGAAPASRGSGGSGGDFDDDTNGNSDRAAYQNVAYPSSSAGTQSSSTASDTTSSPPSGGPSSSSPAAPDTPSTGEPPYASNLDASSPTGFSSPSYPNPGTIGDTGAVSGTSGYPSTVSDGNAASGYPSNSGDFSSGGMAAASGYPSTFPQSAGAVDTSHGNGGDGQDSDFGAGHGAGVRGNSNGIQRTTSSSCDGTIACSNINTTSSEGSATANPAVMEHEQHSDIVPVKGMQAVGEVKTGCPNKDVSVCADSGK